MSRRQVGAFVEDFKAYIVKWDALSSSLGGHVASIEETADEVSCVVRAKFPAQLVSACGGDVDAMKRNLVFKRTRVMSQHFDELNAKISALSGCKVAMQKLVNLVTLELQNIDLGSPESTILTEGSETEPPYCDVVRWHEDVLARVVVQLTEKQFIIRELAADVAAAEDIAEVLTPPSVNRIRKVFASHKPLLDTMRDVHDLCQYIR